MNPYNGVDLGADIANISATPYSRPGTNGGFLDELDEVEDDLLVLEFKELEARVRRREEWLRVHQPLHPPPDGGDWIPVAWWSKRGQCWVDAVLPDDQELIADWRTASCWTPRKTASAAEPER